MTGGDIDSLTRQFLDGELTGDEERDALRRIAEDDGARALLRFDMRIGRFLSDRPRRTAPPDFTRRVMRAIATADPVDTARPAEEGPPGFLTGVRDWLGRPRTIEWKPAHAVLAVAVLALIASGVVLLGGIPAGPGPRLTAGPDPSIAGERAEEGTLAGTRSILAPRADTVLVRFVLQDVAAGSVEVAGDFSDWKPIPLVPHSDGGGAVWTGVVAVPRGEHRYMFVIDGSRWVTDPHASAYWDDGFGNRNAVLSL